MIDKLEHQNRYKVWLADPYHYCLAVLMERYAMFLNTRSALGAHGDVMAESRGKKEDMRLKASFAGLYQKGTEYMGADQMQKCITSKELKVATKRDNIAGLQLADVVGHPSYKTMIAVHGGDAPGPYGQQIAAILEHSKYRRSWDGRIDGFGRKWLP